MAKSLKKKTKSITKNKPVAQAKRRNTSVVDTAEIKDFISFVAQSGLNEVNIETEKLKIHIKRNPDHGVLSPALPVSVTTLPSEEIEKQAPLEKEDLGVEIKSPMIGTFYRSENPTTSPFVSVGDIIKKGQVVCIIEAMKLFNEIESEVSGTVVKVMVENASPVEYEQPLFLVDTE